MTQQHLTIRGRAPRQGRQGGCRRRRGGMTIIYLLVMLTVLLALASFAVDYGRVQLAKTQLRIATDSAAKWGALGVKGGKNHVLARVNEAAADNTVDGVVPRFTLADVQVGSWNAQTRVFTNEGKPYNAVKLTGTQVIPLVLGNVVQKPSVTVRVSAVARTASFGGMIGLNGVFVKNNLFVGSYDSSVNTSPTQATAQANATISSNVMIQAENNGSIMGDIAYGPSGGIDISRWSITGQTRKLDTAIVTPAEPAWSPTGNPGSVPQNYTHTGGTLNGGTYHFTSLTVKGPLTFNGPATIYVNGNIMASGNNSDITAFAGRPLNLNIFQIGANRSFVTENDVAIRAIVVAPRSDFLAKNKISFYGHIAFNTITLMNNSTFFFDENGSTAQTAGLVD